MDTLYAAPLTVLLELNLALNKLFVLRRPVVNAFAFLAGELYQAILRHAPHYTLQGSAAQLPRPAYLPKRPRTC